MATEVIKRNNDFIELIKRERKRFTMVSKNRYGACAELSFFSARLNNNNNTLFNHATSRSNKKLV